MIIGYMYNTFVYICIYHGLDRLELITKSHLTFNATYEVLIYLQYNKAISEGLFLVMRRVRPPDPVTLRSVAISPYWSRS